MVKKKRYRAKIYFSHWIGELYFPIPVALYNVHADIPEEKDIFNILNVVNEPEPTRMSNEKVKKIAKHFDLILTWDTELLKLPNAKLMYMGMTWIPEVYYQNIKLEDKEFKVSFICGTKNSTMNHLMRQKLWKKYDEIKSLKSCFFNSSHNPMTIDYGFTLGPNPEEKIEVFKDFQYHIVIENSCYNNYFSEKIIDCFITKTIPIYVGCPNIDFFFDISGILEADNVEDILYFCKDLTPEFYLSKKKAIETNFQLCKEYARDFTERIYETILEEIERR